jgi:V8-like Glu-specific endopeptidase
MKRIKIQLKFSTLILSVLIVNFIKAQSSGWDLSANCNINVNNLQYQNNTRGLAISSTVKLVIYSSSSVWSCSGVLLNRNTNSSDVGFYILTAKHCINGFDESREHDLIFNYQSPDENNDHTPNSNQGIVHNQSNQFIDDGYEYFHRSSLRKVGDFVWGDLALIEVLTPIPVHFNITYAGWNPSRFINGLQPPTPPETRLVGVHHPKGDIKKMSGANDILWLETPVATGCYTITTIIDVLFGWIWGNRVSTSVICNYIDNPWMVVPPFGFQYGIIEDGSSGSPIFSQTNKVFGVLSGGEMMGCDVPLVATYGKLHANYSNASIKNTLNPNHNVWVDLTGLDGRKIDCFDNLELPGANGVSGNYFPPNHYQYDNETVLRALNNIETTQPITIYPDADYTFKAGNSIILGDGFNVLDGANFHAKIEECNSSKSLVRSIESIVLQEIQEIDLPERKEFDINKFSDLEQKYSSKNNITINIFPNPVVDKLNISISTLLKFNNLRLEIYNLESKLLFSEILTANGLFEHQINMDNFKSGMYFLKVSGNNIFITEKIIKQ